MYVDVKPVMCVFSSQQLFMEEEGHASADIYQRLSEVLVSGQVYNFRIGWEIMDIINATHLS